MAQALPSGGDCVNLSFRGSIREHAGDAMMADCIGQQLGNYRLLRLLGHGGFAAVYLGEHLYLQSHAALKVLHTQLSEQDTAQFMREAQTLARALSR